MTDEEYVRDRERTWGFDWTWSCVGIYSMHVPEMYGFVQFSEKVVGTANVPFTASLELGRKFTEEVVNDGIVHHSKRWERRVE